MALPSQAEDDGACTPRAGRLHWLVGVVAVLLGTGLSLWWVAEVGGPDQVYARYGLLAPLIMLPLHVIVSATPIGEFVPWGVANGMLFGFGGGALLNWIAWMGAAVVQYRIGCSARHDLNWHDRRRHLPRWLARLPIDHPVFLISIRWFPMGGSIFNTVAGAAGIRAPRLLGYAAIGYIPQALVIAAVGQGLLQLF